MSKTDNIQEHLADTRFKRKYDPICRVDNCDRSSRTFGYCTMHLARFRRNGDPLGGRVSIGRPTSYFKKMILVDTSDCINWPFAKVQGYGVMGRNHRVHRQALIETQGEAPADKPLALHTCDNPSCFNPKHLYWGSSSDNTRDMVSRGREYRGSDNHLSKLTVDQVLAIKDSSESQTKLGKIYGVSQAAIFNIKRGKTWRWL